MEYMYTQIVQYAHVRDGVHLVFLEYISQNPTTSMIVGYLCSGILCIVVQKHFPFLVSEYMVIGCCFLV